MRPSGARRFAQALGVVAPLVACSGQSQTTDGGNGPTGGGTPPGNVLPGDLLSDFEEGRAIILPLGSPARNGAWYAYNDASATCLQSPPHGSIYYPSTSAVAPPGASRNRALHGSWNSCSTWGAGVGADFNGPVSDAVAPVKPRVPYDLTPFTGVAFWAMAMPGTQTTVRLKMVMHATTQVEDGGSCDESVFGPNTCGDEWGAPITLPGDGTWKAMTVRFSDPAFKREGWGHAFPWNPADVLGIQLQSAAATGLYDFWIDSLYLLR